MYKFVRAWSRRTLEKAGESVLDVAADDGQEDDADEVTHQHDHNESATAETG